MNPVEFNFDELTLVTLGLIGRLSRCMHSIRPVRSMVSRDADFSARVRGLTFQTADSAIATNCESAIILNLAKQVVNC